VNCVAEPTSESEAIIALVERGKEADRHEWKQVPDS